MKVVEQEILNFDYNVKQLTLKALNRCPGNREAAAKLLGISSRTLQRYKKRFRILRQSPHSGSYYIVERIIPKLKIA